MQISDKVSDKVADVYQVQIDKLSSLLSLVVILEPPEYAAAHK